MPPELVGFLAREFSIAPPSTDEASSSLSEAPPEARPRANRLRGDTFVRLSYVGAGGELVFREADLDWVKQVARWRAEKDEESTLRLMEAARPQDEAGLQTPEERAAAREAFVHERRRDIEAFKGYTGDLVVDGIFQAGYGRRVLSLTRPAARDEARGVNVGRLRHTRVRMRYAGIDGQEIERSVPVWIAKKIADTYASLQDQDPPLSPAAMEDQVIDMLTRLGHRAPDETNARMDARAFRHFRTDALADEVNIRGKSAPSYRVRQRDSDVVVVVDGKGKGKGKGTPLPIQHIPKSEAEHVARLLSLGVPEEVIAGGLHAAGVGSTAADAAALVRMLRSFPVDEDAPATGKPASSPPRLTPAQSRRLLDKVLDGAGPNEIAALFRRWVPGVTFKQSLAMARVPTAFVSPGMGIDALAQQEQARTHVDDNLADMGGTRVRNARLGSKKPVGVAAQKASAPAASVQGRRVAAQIFRAGGVAHRIEVPESVAQFVADMACLAVDASALSDALVERGMAADQVAAWEIIEAFAAHGRTEPSPKGKASAPSAGVPGALTRRRVLDKAPAVPDDLLRKALTMKAQGESLQAVGQHLWRFSVPPVSMAEAMGIAVAPKLFMDKPLARVLSADKKRLLALGIGDKEEQLLISAAIRPSLLRRVIKTLADERDLSLDQCEAIGKQVTRARYRGVAATEAPASFARRYQRPVSMLLSKVETARLAALAGDEGGLKAMLDDLSEGGRLTEDQREAVREHFFWQPPTKRDRRLVMPPVEAGQTEPDADLAIPAHLADTIRLMTACDARPDNVVDAIQRDMPSLDGEDALALAVAFRVVPELVERNIVEDGKAYPLKFAARLKDEAKKLRRDGFGPHFILHRLRQLQPCPPKSSPEEHDSYLQSLMALDRDKT